MKRHDLLRCLEKHGCEFLREDGNRPIYINRSARNSSGIPRHRQIIEFIAPKVCNDLDTPKP
jgi:hypothetical protein